MTSCDTAKSEVVAADNVKSEVLVTDDLQTIKNIVKRLSLRVHENTKPLELINNKNGIVNNSREDKIKTNIMSSNGDLQMDEVLATLRKELMELKTQDQLIAAQFIKIRKEIQQLKLQQSSVIYEEILEEATDQIEAEEMKEHLCDLPVKLRNKNPLTQIGVTRMNIERRRFSTS